MRVVVPIVALLVLARPAAADEAPTTATVAVELTADGVPGWHVDAVERTLAGDVLDERLLAPGEGSAELVLAGALSATELRYRIELPERPPVAGTIALPGLGRDGLARAAREALHDALDRRDAPAVAHGAARLPAPAPLGAVVALGAVALFVVAPFAIRRARPRRRTLIVLGAIAVTAVGLAGFADRVPEATWAILIAGGLAWGAFAVATLPVLFPPLPGLERVEHEDLFRVLRAWVGAVGPRLLLLALFYAPFMLALAGVCVLLDVPALAAVGVIAPLWALTVRHALHTWVDLAARRLDAALVEGPASAENPWHVASIGYLRGYLRRAGWTGDRHLLDDVLLLPGAAEEVVLYGGGLTRPRIVICRAWLELALAPYGRPHDYAAPRVSTLEWNEWNAGLVVPTEVGALVATREQRQPREPEPFEEQEHEPFGEPPTLAGYVEPDQLDRRGAHRPEEDPLWLDWDPGDEPDGTDPSDKDFLFGLLVEQLGRIQRHEDRTATLALALRGGRLDRLTARVRRLLGRRTAILDDIHAALNVARHHRVQYLAWRHRPDIELTARAYPPELERRAAELLPELPAGAAPYYRARAPGRRERIVRRAVLATALVAGLALFTAAALDAIDYHPTYQDRIQPQEEDDGEED